MPRGQKSKLRAREKRRQAQGETRLQGAQATATKEKISSSSSSHLGDITENESPARSRSTLKKPRRAPSTNVSVDVSHTRSCEEADSKIEKKPSPTQAPPSTTQSRRSPLTKTINTLVNFLIHMYKMKKQVTKTGILKFINKRHKKHFPEILRQASFSLEVVFGIDLKKVDSPKHSYALVSKMDLPYRGMLSRGKGFPKTGLLMNLLGVIFMNGNCASEEMIWNFLNKMKIYDGKRHFLFGEPRKLITQDLVKLKYLEYRQVPNSDPARYEFLWGPRAHAETSKMKVLEFLAMVNKTVPSAFHFWYEEALRDEEERAQATVTLNEGTNATTERSRAMSSSSSHN
ncbi:melanoma-associated antigen B3-like [Cynocephalus volans]|uniref:melanoma-associated antigen B3-like n=1 Tax=Cynocephalus volans TaxID=110931 RepID=UPI002FC9E948